MAIFKSEICENKEPGEMFLLYTLLWVPTQILQNFNPEQNKYVIHFTIEQLL